MYSRTKSNFQKKKSKNNVKILTRSNLHIANLPIEWISRKFHHARKFETKSEKKREKNHYFFKQYLQIPILKQTLLISLMVVEQHSRIRAESSVN